jgi:dimethylamine corrinoid protein
MKEEEELLVKLKSAILKGEPNNAIELVNKSINMGIPVKEILNKAILKGAEEAGNLYEKDEYFLPDLLMTGDAINVATDLLKNSLKEKSEIESKGTILIGTVEGDVHYYKDKVLKLLI